MAQLPQPLSALSAAPSTNAGDNLQRVDAPAAAFGAETAAALQGVGRELRGAAAETEQTLLAYQGMQNETMANDARNNAVLAASKRLTDYKMLEGQNAVAGQDAYISDVQKIFKDAGDALPNPATKQMYNQVAGRYVNNFTIDAASHAATENKKWQQKSSLATQEIAANTAVQMRMHPDQVAAQAQVAADEAFKQSEIDGEDVKTAMAKAAIARGKVYSPTILALAADPATVPLAQTILNQSRDKMDAGSVARLEEHLHPKVLSYQADATVARYTRQVPDALPLNTDAEVVWSGMKVQESGGRQFKPGTNVPEESMIGGDNPVGVSQIRPSTAREVAMHIGVPFDENRLRTDAAYNELLGKAYFNGLLKQYGDPSIAMAAYNAGPGRVDGWLKDPKIGDPRTGAISTADFIARIPLAETRDYVRNISGKISGNDPNNPLPLKPITDPQKMMRDAAAETAGSPELQRMVLSRLSSFLHEQESFGAQKRSALAQYSNDLGAQFLDGNPANAAIPREDIRANFPKDKAELLIGDLEAKLTAGQMFKGLALATPDTIASMRQDLIEGNGVFSATLKGKGVLLRGPDGEIDPADNQSAADYRTRKMIAAELENQIKKRNDAIAKDPAAYVIGNDPMVKALVPGPDATPEDWQAFATSTLAAQARLGVEPWKRSVLPVGQADAIVQQFMHATPDKFDARGQMIAMSKQYDKVWPQVFNQLQRQNLPSQYRVLGIMDAPGQTAAGAALQQAFVTEFEAKGGRAALKEKIPKDQLTTLDETLASALAPFKATTMFNSGGERAYLDVYNAAEALALHYHNQGKIPEDAAKAAVNGIINQKYDVRDGYRIPKYIDNQPVSSANVVDAAEAIKSNLKLDDMADIEGGTVPGLTPEDRKASLLAGAQSSEARWLNNATDDGLILTFLTRGGAYEPVRLANGRVVQFKFANPPATESTPYYNENGQQIRKLAAPSRTRLPMAESE